jgi:hypothetical protein
MSEDPPEISSHELEPEHLPRVLAEKITLEMVTRPGPNVKPRKEEWDRLFGEMGVGWIFETYPGEEHIGHATTTVEGERFAREGLLPEELKPEEPEHRGGLKGYADDRKRRGLPSHLDD